MTSPHHRRLPIPLPATAAAVLLLGTALACSGAPRSDYRPTRAVAQATERPATLAASPRSTDPGPSATPRPTPTLTPTASPTLPIPTVSPPAWDLVLDQLVEQALDEFGLVGAIVGAQSGSEPPVVRAYGRSDASAAVRPDAAAPFPIGSLTKQFTAAAVLRLVEEGALRLDDPIGRHLDGVPSSWDQITVRSLLNHTSGLQDLAPEVLGALDPQTHHDVDDVIELITLRNPSLLTPPGSTHSYISVGYYLLGAIIEAASGMPYGEVLSQTIAPSGLRRTQFSPALDLAVVPGHVRSEGGYLSVRPVHPSLTYSVGGVTSTAADLLAWQSALASSPLYEVMAGPAVLTDGATVPYGLGLRLNHPSCEGGTYHTGRLLGYESLGLYCPEHQLSVVVLLNSNPADPAAIEVIGSRIADAILASQP